MALLKAFFKRSSRSPQLQSNFLLKDRLSLAEVFCEVPFICVDNRQMITRSRTAGHLGIFDVRPEMTHLKNCSVYSGYPSLSFRSPHSFRYPVVYMRRMEEEEIVFSIWSHFCFFGIWLRWKYTDNKSRDLLGWLQQIEVMESNITHCLLLILCN